MNELLDFDMGQNDSGLKNFAQTLNRDNTVEILIEVAGSKVDKPIFHGELMFWSDSRTRVLLKNMFVMSNQKQFSK